MERAEMNKKRERDHVEDQQEANKKQELICFDHDHDFFTLTDSTFRPLGVFDFPWLKENRVSESDDWKFDDDDEFSYNLLVNNTAAPPEGLEFPGEVPVLFQGTHDDEIVDEFTTTGEKLEGWISNVDETDGVDCIWSCVLNQPLALGPDRKNTR